MSFILVEYWYQIHWNQVMHFNFTVIKTILPFCSLYQRIFLWNTGSCTLWYSLFVLGPILTALRWSFWHTLSAQVGTAHPSSIYPTFLILWLSIGRFENDKEEFLSEARKSTHQYSRDRCSLYTLLCLSSMVKCSLASRKKSFSSHHHSKMTNQNHISLHNPKFYTILTWVRTMFSGFKSRWAILFRCRYSTPSSTWAIILLALISSIFLQGVIVPSSAYSMSKNMWYSS